MHEVLDPRWPEFAGRTYVPAIRATGSIVFTSGLNAMGTDGDVQCPGDVVGQARAIYLKLDELLRTLGASRSDIVKTTDYVVSRSGYAKTAEVRRDFFGNDFPAATGVVVSELFGAGVLIEIDAVVVLPMDPPAGRN